MKILVIGSGLIGLTTAYFLRERGHEVSLVDRQAGPGLETSYANGALLTPSMPHPWNSPGSWRVLLSSLVRSDSALKLRVRALPSLGQWGWAFLRNSQRMTFERNALHNLRLALYSGDVMNRMRERIPLDYGRVARGTLRIFRDPAALEQAGEVAKRLSSEGVRFQSLSARETGALEPALRPIQDQLSGAIHYQTDEAGDAHQFCVAIAREAQRAGVSFFFDTEVSALETFRGRIVALATSRGRLVADSYIVAAGSYSAPLLRTAGLRLPVRPAKGYSITLKEGLQRAALSIPVVDDDLHAAVVPLGRAIRVADTAESAGYDRSIDPARIANLFRLLRTVLPAMRFDPRAANPWCGLRPMSADGVPIMGVTPVTGLFVSTGHGHLGWTMAAGSAHLMASLVCGEPPALDPAPYAFTRFAS
jgi:D-amino-acid dehydrogenase